MKILKKIYKSIVVAFSMYSTIPMPKFEWNSEDMNYHLIFFPLVGAIIAALDYGWMKLTLSMPIGDITRVLVTIAIPLIVTGGFHVDGFMDTCDALKSYGSREKKLEILKDPHIGAFSVICLLIYMLLAIAAFLEIREEYLEGLVVIPVMSRAVSGLIVTNMTPAKSDGMLKSSADNNAGFLVNIFLIITIIICLLLMGISYPKLALIITLTEVVFFILFRRRAYREFGGVTGDLAGFYLLIAELAAILITAIWGLLVNI